MTNCNRTDSIKKNEFVSTNFKADTCNLVVRQIYKNPKQNDFLVVFFKESSMSFGSGNKLMKLYNSDSISVDECFYGAHPLIIKDWNDSLIYIDVEVFSGHGDSTYRDWYLDNSVDKNDNIGGYKIHYNKNYNY